MSAKSYSENQILKGPWNSSQTWTCGVKFDKTLSIVQFEANWCDRSLVMAWKMKQTEDHFYGNVITHKRSSLQGITVARILGEILSNHYSFNLLSWWSNVGEKALGIIPVSHFCTNQVQVCEDFQGPLISSQDWITFDCIHSMSQGFHPLRQGLLEVDTQRQVLSAKTDVNQGDCGESQGEGLHRHHRCQRRQEGMQ